MLINYASEHYDFGSMSASDVVRFNADWDGKSANPLQQLKDKIVLLGGSYRAARDEYRTPFGSMPGVKIIAHAIESELGGRIRFPRHEVMLLVEFAVGVFLIVLHNSVHKQKTILYWDPGAGVSGWQLSDIIVLPLIFVGASYLAFSSFALWANFVPVVVAVRLHMRWDNYRELRKQWKLQDLQ